MRNDHGESENDFEVEITDIPPDEARSISGAVLDLGTRFLARMRDTSTSGNNTHPDEMLDEPLNSDVEITDLPTDEPYRTWTPSPTLQQLRQPKIRNVGFISLTAILSLVFIIILSNTWSVGNTISSVVGYFTMATPTPVQHSASNSSSFISIPKQIDSGSTGNFTDTGGPITLVAAPVPQDCPLGTSVGDHHDITAFPVTLMGFDGPNATIHLLTTYTPNFHGWKGWAIPLKVMIKPNYIDPITITLGNLRDGPSPTFSPYNSIEPAPSQAYSTTFEPLHPNDTTNRAVNTGPNAWQTVIHIPGSGCYFINISWPRGNQQVIFAAGR